MSNMKCPKCGGRLVYWGATGALLKCEQCHFGWGNEELWQELIRTRKALDVAVDGIKYMRNNCLEYAADYMDKADEILEQITALEQKDVK